VHSPGLAAAFLRLHQSYQSATEQLLALGRRGDSGLLAASPEAAVHDFFRRHRNHFRELEEAADASGRRRWPRDRRAIRALKRRLREPAWGVRAGAAGGRPARHAARHDERAGRGSAVGGARPSQPGLPARACGGADRAAHAPRRLLARTALASDARDQARLPGGAGQLLRRRGADALWPFLAEAQASKYDFDHLATRFGVSFEQACHRATTLQREGAQGVPFFFLRIDKAGNVTKRFNATEFRSPNTAAPARGSSPHLVPHARSDRAAVRRDARRQPVFRVLAHRGPAELRAPCPGQPAAVAMGCAIEHTPEIGYAEAFRSAGAQMTEIGINCRICPRANCDQRAGWRKLRKGQHVAGEFRRIGKRGNDVWIQASYNPVLDEEGKPVKIVKFATDVTEARQRAADASGQIAAFSKSQAVIEFDLDGTIRTANDNFLAAVGYRLDDVKGKHHRIFCDPAYASSPDYAAFWRKLGQGEFVAGEFRRIGKRGNDIWIQASYNPIFDHAGKPFKVVKVATDITARKQAVEKIRRNLEQLADGVMSARIGPEVDGDFASLRDAFNATTLRLEELVTQIITTSTSIGRATQAIADGAQELSQRAESQAAALEETSATMEEMSASIRANADNSSTADEAAREAARKARRGGAIVTDAVAAMDRIETSASRIADIITVIESIAFQTNLLALNAAVEAARAGDAGKGFAVVASEVRTLAQRSSEAAKDITGLIQSSTGEVAAGARLVRQTGEALTEITGAVEAVAGSIGEITAATREQAAGAQEISSTVSHMDETTQRTSALASESAGHAMSAAGQVEELRDLVAFFRTESDAGRRTARVLAAE
jgi:PAS domain S-box-containing protein